MDGQTEWMDDTKTLGHKRVVGGQPSTTLIWVQTVYKGYQQMTKVTASKVRVHPFIIPDWKAVEGCIVMRIKWALSRQNLSSGFPTKRDSNQPAQL